MSDGHDESTARSSGPVGYGRPPAAHAFKPGQSGNPKGRPRKPKTVPLPPAVSQTMASDMALLQEAYRPIQLREGETVMTLSMVSAVYRAMGVSALKGNRFAARTFAERVERAEARRRDGVLEIVETAAQYKHDWTDLFDDRAARGLPPLNVLPHPRDIVDGPDGMPYVVGPRTEQDQHHWEKLQARAAVSDSSIREELADLKFEGKQPYREFIFDDIVYEHRIRSMLRHAAPSPYTRRKLHYRRPTREDLEAFSAETKTRYRLFAELTEAERTAFIWEMERYESELVAGRIP